MLPVQVGSGPLDRYKKCQGAVEAGKAKWGYETTVGAGLPITHVLKKDLLQTGDKVKKIEVLLLSTAKDLGCRLQMKDLGCSETVHG